VKVTEREKKERDGEREKSDKKTEEKRVLCYTYFFPIVQKFLLIRLHNDGIRKGEKKGTEI